MKALSRSLRARLVLAGALIVLFMAAMGFACAMMFAHVSSVVGQELRRGESRSELGVELASALEDEDDALLLAVSGDHTEAVKKRAIEQRRFDSTLARMRGEVDSAPAWNELDRLEEHVRAFRASGDRLLDQEDVEDARAVYDADTTTTMHVAIADCTRIRDREVRATRRTAAWARDESRRAMSLVAIASIVALGLAMLVGVMIARSIVKPIAELTENVRAVSEGSFDRRVTITREDEIGALAHGYNSMAEALSKFSASKIGEIVRAKAALEATMSALPDAIILVGPTGQVEAANPRAQALLDTARASMPNALAEVGRGEAVDLSRAIRVDDGDGHHRFLPSVVWRTDSNGERAGAVVVFRDVTDIARLDEMRMDFVAAASHELRTPLTTLKMMLSMIAEGERSRPAAEDEMLKTALVGCEQLGRTVDALLDTARAETNAIRLHREHTAARLLALDAARAVATRVADAGVTLDVSVDADGCDVDADPARIAIVLENVLGNALKYSTNGSRIELSIARADDGMVEIAVNDEGPGVPAELRERVFEKYFRVEHVRARSGHAPRGSGMGLYLCRQIVEAHGGTIRCEEGAREKGTRIVFSLPRAAAEVASAPLEPAENLAGAAAQLG